MGKKKNNAVEIDEDDPWRLIDPPEKGKPWEEKSCWERFMTCILVMLKVCLVLGFLYLFICSLDFLSSAFRLLGGKQAGRVFRENEILSNPIADMTMGVLATVLLQSSSTTTSIVVAMVAGDILTVRPAIFIIMGANIGTSVTNTIVALGQAMDKNEFRRAFAGATVHDMFNWLSVIILLPIEWLSGSFGGQMKDCGILCKLTEIITEPLENKNPQEEAPELLKVITKPFTSLVIQIDKDVVKDIAKGDTEPHWENATLVKHYCEVEREVVVWRVNDTDLDGNGVPMSCYMPPEDNGTMTITRDEPCDFLFNKVSREDGWSDAAVGVCVLIIALAILILCLIAIVKLLHSLLQGSIAKIIKKFLNSNLPSAFGRFITGYIAILIGAGLTILVQSSSIFTSAMTPLVGVGVLHIKRMYPLTLGANIGTTVTAILAALAADQERLRLTMQVALCHLFFNIGGILIWYPIPAMRKVPITLAKILGNTTAKYRWFAVMYLIIMFFIFPAAVLGLSLAGWKVLLGVGLPIFVLFWIIVIINVMQRKCPERLCGPCQNWNWLPKPLHSLEPYDRLFSLCCKPCRSGDSDSEGDDVEQAPVGNGKIPPKNGAVNGIKNESYHNDEINTDDDDDFHTKN